MVKKILFIFHEDSQSGAPNALLSFLNYVNEHHKNTFIIDIFVLNSKNGIETELKKIARKFYIKRRKKNLIGKVSRLFNPNLFFIQNLNKYDVIYGNTVLTIKHLYKLKERNPSIKTILHAHESKFMCSILLDQNTATQQLNYIDKIFTVSKAAKNNLIVNYKVSDEKISIINPTIQNLASNTAKNEINYDKNCFTIVTIGHPNLTKGTDLIPIITSILKNRKNITKFKVLIVGILNDNEYIKSLKSDIEKLQLNNNIELIPHTKTPLDYLNLADIYIIPSREDSFSLMGLHAALFNKPIVAFKNAIGLQDILDENCIFLADYLDLEDFTNQIEFIYNHPEIVKNKTELAKSQCQLKLDYNTINEKHFMELERFVQ